jgi:hypothetical protein
MTFSCRRYLGRMLRSLQLKRRRSSYHFPKDWFTGIFFLPPIPMFHQWYASNFCNQGATVLCLITAVEVDGLDDRPGNHSNKSLIIGANGPYIPLPSHSYLASLGPQTWLLLLDCR